MRAFLSIILAILILIILLFLSGTFYTVPQTQQVVITQFGKPIGNPIIEPGLHFKTPFVQKAHYFDKRLLEWDGAPTQIPTKDKKYIWLDTTARWKIVDPLLFLQTVYNELGAASKLGDILNSATRDSITNHPLVEAVRNSNRIIKNSKTKKALSNKKNIISNALDPIQVGRAEMEKLILEETEKLAPEYGIQVVDVRIKRLNYISAVREKVYDRMIAERKRAAEMERSEGQGKKAVIDGKREKELKLIESNAYRKAEVIMGKADAQATKIYTKAYSLNPEYYSFKKTVETYRKTFDDKTTLILSTDNDYLKILTKPDYSN
ncbi:MAG: protease modulator HflC [Victivallales bacterium]|nr:protease modulator HflC [Victivallales bacterium]